MTERPTLKLPALDPATVEVITGTNYPAEFAPGIAEREKRRLGDALGLTQFGVNMVRLKPGIASSQRHWHSREDEFVIVLEGTLILVTDGGEQTLGPGMVAGFPAGTGDGHQLVNRSGSDAVYLEVGSRDDQDDVDYSDIDLIRRVVDGRRTFLHRDGTPYLGRSGEK